MTEHTYVFIWYCNKVCAVCVFDFIRYDGLLYVYAAVG
jgi:hypothetical protein